ncbi:protein kinase [Actinoplanes sp. NPDC049599]|uniref:serine/threonine-protein kinase n=1 Tax=Actinoplanes sp. NPDC049599 TaxID=3363903 RepID=UPI0037B0271E
MDQDPTGGGLRPDSDGASTLDLSGRCVGSSYLLVRPIGQGATGTVWRGVDRSSGEPVAVKLLHGSLLRQPKLVTRFVQERTILLMLRHRNVVRVRDLFSVGESLALVMDLVPGGSLREYLRDNHTLAPGEAARLAAQVAAALAEAHELGIIHRDLKPDNILLHRADGRLDTRLTDFGIARVLSTPSLTTSNAVVGTPHYMAPEAFQSSTVSPAADMYALGVLLYEMVCGRPPYDSDTVHDLMRLHLAGNPERLPGIPDALWEIISACLEQKPRLRPTAAELIADLSAVTRTAAEAPALSRPALSRPDRSGQDAAEPSPAVPSSPVPSSPVPSSPVPSSPVPSSPVPSSPVPSSPDPSPPDPEPDRQERAGAPSPGVAPDRPGSGGQPGTAPLVKPEHPSLAGMRVPAPRRRNQPATWRWGRPWATIAVVSAAMLASGVATTAWHVARSAGDPPATAAAPPLLPLDRPAGSPAASRSAPVAQTTAPSKPATERRRPAAAVAAQALTPVRPAATRTSSTRPPVREARPYGPDACHETFGLAGYTPLMVTPCHALGTRVRMRATLTAPTPGEGRITLALRDVGTGRTVGDQKVCAGLVFSKATPARSCGPVTVSPPRGHRYQVVMSWTFANGQRSQLKVTRGDEFTW